MSTINASKSAYVATLHNVRNMSEAHHGETMTLHGSGVETKSLSRQEKRAAYKAAEKVRNRVIATLASGDSKAIDSLPGRVMKDCTRRVYGKDGVVRDVVANTSAFVKCLNTEGVADVQFKAEKKRK